MAAQEYCRKSTQEESILQTWSNEGGGSSKNSTDPNWSLKEKNRGRMGGELINWNNIGHMLMIIEAEKKCVFLIS